jgi:hypothetical protein
MAAPLCSTDYNNQYFTIYYHRSDAIVYLAGPMTYAFVASTLARLQASGLTPIAVTSSGPNGNYTYAASGFDGYMKAFGGGNPWPSGFGGPPGGLIDDNGALYCTPPPSDSGGGPNCPTGYYYDPETELCVPTPSPPGWPPAPIGPPGGGFGGGGNPPPPPPPLQCQVPGNVPMVFGACPLGYVPDPNDEGCCKPAAAVVPPPGGGGLPPPTGQPDPYGDDITQTLCAQMQANTLALISAINGIGSPSGGAPDPTCCANVVAAIGAVAFQLNAILVALPKLTGGAPADLSPIVTQLTAMASSLAQLATAPAMDLAPLTAAINDVARAIASAAPSDVSGIVKALNTIADQGDVDQPILDAMQQQGFITPDDLQVLQGIKWSDAISYFTGGAPIRFVIKMMTEIGADEVAVVNSVLNYAAPGINWAEQKVQDALSAERNLLLGPIRAVLDKVKAAVRPAGPVTLFNTSTNADQALADVATTMLDLKLMQTLVALFREGAGEQLEHLSERILAIVGLEEIREVQLGPLVAYGMGRQAEHNAKATFMQELPGVGEVSSWLARGLIDKPTAEAIMKFNGRHTDLYPVTAAAAQHGMSPRIMLRLIDNGLFTDAEIADELTFSGMRPASQHRMIVAAGYLSTQPQRHQLQAAYEAQYRIGLLDQADLTKLLDAADHNTDRDDLIIRRVNSEILVDEAKLLIVEYASLFKVGSWTDTQYRAQLAGLGLQQWKIDLEAGKAEAAANVATYRHDLAAAAAIERATVAAERKAAMEGFKSGALNASSLAAALSLTGLTPTQSAAWVALAGLQQSGALRWIYGLLRSPAEAGLLRARVSALADQRKRLQIDDPAFVGALQAMGIPDRYINALRAATDALISPKTAAVTIPVQTT